MLAPMRGVRTWVEIDLEAIRANARALRRELPSGVGCIAVLKANAYGHGAREVASALDETGLRAFAVTSCGEAASLSRAGLRTPILVLGPTDDEELDQALRHDWELVLSSREGVEAFLRRMRRCTGRARVHVKVNTGMHRLGLEPREVGPALRTLRAEPNVEVVGLLTHLAATSGALDPAAWAQSELFGSVVREVRTGALLPPTAQVHAASSAALLSGLAAHHDLVRPGLALFGISPHPRLPARDLRPALSWRARVVQTRIHPPGIRVGYEGRFQTRRRTVLATVAAGYEDGVDRRADRGGRVLVRGRSAPLVGQVSMDYFTADVTDVPGVTPGDVVTLIGRDGEGRIGVEELARTLDTIPYEVLCSFGARVGRIHRGAPPSPDAAGRRGAVDSSSRVQPCASSSSPS